MAQYSPAIETLSVDELAALRWKKLRYHLEHTYRTNAFYRRLWERHGVRPEDIRTLDDYRGRVPLVRKQDLLNDQQAPPPFGTRIGVPPEQLAGIYWTSGTTGIGQELYGHTTADTFYYGHTWTHGLYWAGVRRGDRFFNCWPGTVGQLAGPDSMTRGLMLLGANAIHVGTQSTDDKLKHMRRFSPQHLAAVPAYLQRLTAACEEAGLVPREAFPDLQSIVLATEAYSADWARQMEEIWGARLQEMYGSTQQGGGLAFTCERGAVPDGRHGQMHILEHLSYVEVLHPETREPVGEGEEGEIVLTTLTRDASTLLRFATDDKVVYLPGGSCPCGRPFAAFLAGNISRYDDMLKIRMVNVWPSAVDAVLFAYPEVAEYQGRVFLNDAGQETVTVRVELKPTTPPDRREPLRAELERQLRGQVGTRMDVVEADEPLPRFEFKVRRWTDERKQGRQRVLYTAR